MKEFPMHPPIEILYQDDDLVAVNKPAGLLVHRSAIDRHETRFLMQTVRDQLGRRVYPVHRLDKPTSGIVVMALNSETARLLTEQFAQGGVKKEYLAVVRGYTDERGVIDYPLKEKLDAMTDRKARRDKPTQEAITKYQRLATVELPYPVGRYQTARYSMLKVMPKTGRKHQIRRHMKHIFHPIVGDTTYGDGKQNEFFREHFHCCQLLLNAIAIEFNHPKNLSMINIKVSSEKDLGCGYEIFYN